MKPGINREAAVFKVRLAVMLLCVLAWTGAPLPVFANGAARDPRLALSVMEKEAYFYFFLEDYLNTATHLKLLDNAATVKKDEDMLHQSRYLSGGLYLSWGMHTPAARIFNDLLTAFPAGKKRNEVFLAIGRMRYERALYLPALETFRRFEPNDIFPGSDEAVYLAGMSHHALGAMKEGNAALSRIRPESRFYPYARLALAKSYFVLEEVEASLNLLEELSQYETSGDPLLKSLREQGRLTWGHLLMEAGRPEQAHAVLSLIPEESPFYPEALFGMAWARFLNKDGLESILLFQDLIAHFPNHPRALESMTALGHAYHRLEADQHAVKRYEEAIAVYTAAEEHLHAFQSEIQNLPQLAVMVADEERQGLLLELTVEGEAVRYWRAQYRELLELSALLDQKRRDMDVFEVMIDHRETVFDAFQTTLNASPSAEAVSEMAQKIRVLKARLNRSIDEERLSALGTPRDETALRRLAAARKTSAAIGAEIQKLIGAGSDTKIAGLKSDWRTTDRWLQIAEGDMVWRLSTSLPGRVDDLRRTMRSVTAAFTKLEARQAQWLEAGPALKTELAALRHRIENARRQVDEKIAETDRVRQAILPVLQKKLLAAADQRLERLAGWRSTAELARLQILDARSVNQ